MYCYLPFDCQFALYKKSVYDEIGFLDISDSIQGDDTLFLQLCAKKNKKVIFNDNPNSFFKSRIENNLWCFIKQRIRWAADLKVMWNYNKILFLISLSTFVINSVIILLTLDCLFFQINDNLKILYTILMIKIILELILYIIGGIKLKLNINPIGFIYWFILEIPYVVFMGIGSFFVQFIEWRGQTKYTK